MTANITKIIPIAQATALATHNIHDLKDKSNRHNFKKIVKIGVEDMVGLELMRNTAGLI